MDKKKSDYEWLTEMNLCHKCRKQKPAPGKKFCFDCLDAIREDDRRRYDSEKAKQYQKRRREIYREKKANGICVRCSKPSTHGIYCYECSIKQKRRSQERAKIRRIERLERGLIPDKRKKRRAMLMVWKSCGRWVTVLRISSKDIFRCRKEGIRSESSEWKESMDK